MNSLQKTAVVGSLVSALVLAISLALPVLMGPNVSWEEAAFGYVPAGVALLGFQLLQLAAGRRPATGESGSGEPASFGKASLNVLALAAVLAGGVGAAFCAAKVFEGAEIARDETARKSQLEARLAAATEGDSQADSDEIAELKQQIEWLQPENYLADARLFRNWGIACGLAAIVGAGYAYRSFRGR